MGGNAWGTACPTPLPKGFSPGQGDVAVPAGQSTLVLDCGGLLAVSPGTYYPVITGVLAVLFGAVAPGELFISASYEGGSNFDGYQTAPGLLVALSTVLVPVCLVGPATENFYPRSTPPLNLYVYTDTQPVTVKTIGSRIKVAICRGPD